MWWGRDEETTRLSTGLRSIKPVVHSLEAGDIKMVVMGACVRRAMGEPGNPDEGRLRLCFASASTERTHGILVEDFRVVEGGIEGLLVDPGWLDGAPPVPIVLRPLSCQWIQANGYPQAADFWDDSDPVQVELLRQQFALFADPFASPDDPLGGA